MRRGWVLVFVAGCAGGGDDGGPVVEATACEGAGAPELEVGSGGRDGFEAWQNGDPVVVETDGSGRWGFYGDLLTRGLDTTASTTAFVRYTIGDDPATEDVGATLTLYCPTEGPGWFGLFVPLDDDLQNEAAIAGIVGLDLHLTATVADQAEEAGTAELDLVIAQ